jgi:hypothetical protein
VAVVRAVDHPRIAATLGSEFASGEDPVTDSESRPHSEDLSTGERLATTLRAVGQGAAHMLKGEHETERGRNGRVSLAEARNVIGDWPAPQKNVAEQMLNIYGPPNELTPTQLFWYRNGPWKRTVLVSDSVVHHWPAPHTDFLTQYIDYRVPPEMAGKIAEFDGSILVDRTRGEVAARCDSEAANVLGINMVHEIVTGKRTVAEARHTSEQNTVAYSLGRNAPYAERILFEPQTGTPDPDQSKISAALVQQAAAKAKDLATGEESEPTERLSE